MLLHMLTRPRRLSSTCATSNNASPTSKPPTHDATLPHLPHPSSRRRQPSACAATTTMKSQTKTKKWKTPYHPPTSSPHPPSRDTHSPKPHPPSTPPTEAHSLAPLPHPQPSCPTIAPTGTGSTRRTPPPRYVRQTHTTTRLDHVPQ